MPNELINEDGFIEYVRGIVALHGSEAATARKLGISQTTIYQILHYGRGSKHAVAKGRANGYHPSETTARKLGLRRVNRVFYEIIQNRKNRASKAA